MSRATEDLLDTLHGLLAESLLSELKQAKADASKVGEDRKPINPQLLDKVMKFLQLNGVDAPAKSPRLSNLIGELRDLDLDQVGSERAN